MKRLADPMPGISGVKTEALNLERGLAILEEKGINAAGYEVSSMEQQMMPDAFKDFDLVVVPYLHDGHYNPLLGFLYEEAQAVLFFISGH